MILNSTTTLIIALVCYFVVPFLVILFVKNERALKIFTWIIFSIYLVILLIGVWTRVSIKNGVVNISLDYSYGFFNKSVSWGFLKLTAFDIAVNLIMLLPVGVVYCIIKPMKFPKQLLKGLILGLILGICIELGQFILPVQRSVQLSDVVFNTISVIVGVIVGKCMLTLRFRGNKKQKPNQS